MKPSKISRQRKPAPQIGISISKDPTGPIPPLSSAESHAGQAEQSKQLVKAESLPTHTANIQKQSRLINQGVPTPPAMRAVLPTEKSRLHADFARASILQLQAAGLLEIQRVLAKDGGEVLAIRINLNPSIWTEDLRLRA